MPALPSDPAPDETLWAAFQKALDACGVTPEQRLRAVARTVAKHGKIIGGRLDMYTLDTFASALLEETGDVAIGLRLGLSMERGSTGVIEYALLTAPSLRVAQEVYSQLGVIVDEYVRYQVDEAAGYAFVRMRTPAELPLHRVLEDYRVMRLLAAIRRALGEPAYVPSALLFTYPKSDSPANLEELAGRGAEVLYGQPHAGLRLPASDLDRELAQSDPMLHQILLASAMQWVQQAEVPSSVTAKVQQVLTATLHRGRPSSLEVCRALAVSERTLRRRLSDEGTSFAEVLDEVRKRMLDVLGESAERDVKAAAHQLGFESVRSFRRAQRRWRGQA